MRVEAVLSGRLAASSRFRVEQHVEPLAALGISVRARPPRVSKYAAPPYAWRRLGPLAAPVLTGAKLGARVPAVARSWTADLTWLEREILPGHRTLEGVLHRPLLFDVDDAVWLFSDAHRRAVTWTGRRAAGVVAGNDYIAEWFEGVGASATRVWTAVDTHRFRPPADRDRTGFVVGWTGSRSALRYLADLATPLGRFLEQVPEATLLVVADGDPWLPGIPADRVHFVRWSAAEEAELVRRMDVGIAPLPDSPWARGKCAFKMLQYMATGVPVVASPVGMNGQLLGMAEVGLAAPDEAAWVDALQTLYRDSALRSCLGAAGRALVEERFSVPVIAGELAGVMRRYG
jgi:glycosyltransferase involved in cell wall biosynthesis